MLQRGGPVARALRITGPTRGLAVALPAAVSLNGAIAAQAVGLLGQAMVLAVIFASVAVCFAAISADVLSRSAKAVSDLRSIGASRGSISSALFGSMLTYGAAGAAAGSLVGTIVGSVLVGPGPGTGTLVDVVFAVAATAGAVAAGSFAGGRTIRRS